MKIAWVHLLPLLLTTHCVLSQVADVEINNEVSEPTPKSDLDSNLRKALLKALTELENDDTTNEFQNDQKKDRNIEKASASSVSIISSTTTNDTTDKSVVVLQKSQGIQHPSISSFEKASDESEQILSSATSSFTNLPFEKSSREDKYPQPQSNSIDNFDKTTNRIETTTLAVSTEESEAKVEDVQFFSAPLVAAFTVHQDELGLPKKVEPIYRSAQPQRVEEVKHNQRIEAVRREHELIKLAELRRQQEKIQQQFQLEQKKNKLEQEIQRLNFDLKRQQELFLRQQEELRKRVSSQQFLPFVNPNIDVVRPSPNQQLPVRTADQFKVLQSSIAFDPLVEAGKLPLNAQILPIKEPVNFLSPFRQQGQATRFFRQNAGVGNLGVNRNTNSFSIQQSLQPGFESAAQGNRFLRSNLESTLTAPAQFLPNNNRFFRSNLESSFGAQGSYNNYQLSNLLYDSGALRGKSSQDLSLISKVLSYDNNFGNSVREHQQPYLRHF